MATNSPLNPRARPAPGAEMNLPQKKSTTVEIIIKTTNHVSDRR
jgi:hypothetical protein